MSCLILSKQRLFFCQLCCSLSLLAFFLWSAIPLYAAAGDVDPTFGNNGVVTTNMGTGMDQANAVLVQPDGKLLVAGYAANANDLTHTQDFMLARYLSNGLPDNSFGTEGKVVTAVGSGVDVATALALQADNRIIVAGYSDIKGFALIRFNSDGSLDSSFGTAGIATTFIGSTAAVARAVAIQRDGKILVAGHVRITVANQDDFIVARYLQDGSLDWTFGVEGIAAVNTSGNSGDAAYALAIQADGKVVVAGADGMRDFVLVRLNSTGDLDPSFDVDGKVTTAIGDGNDEAYAIALQSDGKILAAGYATVNGLRDFAVVRYNNDGTLDTSFDTDGKAITPIGSYGEQINALLIQSDGKITVAGYTETDARTDFALARYNGDGTLDSSFGTNGKIITTLSSNKEEGLALAQQSDGKLVVAGVTDTGYDDDSVLLRYTSNGSLDTAFGTNGIVITQGGDGYDEATAIVLQNDGKVVVAGNTAGQSSDFVLARYNNDGKLDRVFGSGGKITAKFSDNGNSVNDIALQSDEKILVAGSTSGNQTRFALARYTAAGILDTTFGTNGKVATLIAQGSSAVAVTVQSDGKIILAGKSFNGTDYDFTVVRYNVNGSVDTTFGTTGRTVTSINAGQDEITGMALQDDGKIVVAGFSSPPSGFGVYTDFALVRYNSNGSLDSTFGTGGKVLTSIGDYDDKATDIVLQSDGKIVVTGNTYDYTYTDFAVVRYNSDGSLDSTFGTGGITITDIEAFERPNSVALQRDGKIIIAGSMLLSGLGGNVDIALLRYRSTGTLDRSFGTNGVVTTAIGNSYDSASAIAIQSDDKIIAAGRTSANLSDFALIRYIGQGVNQPPTANGQTVSFNEDSTTSLTLTATDLEDEPLTYQMITQPSHGALTGTAPNLTYTPATNYHGPDSFTFKANDGQFDSSVATVNITINPINDVPTGSNQTVATNEDTALPITLTAADVDGNPLTYSIVTNPSRGTLTGSGANRTYTPAANYHGPDGFTFKVNDGQVDSNVATVNITVNPVNDPPTAGSQSVSTNEDTALPITLAGNDVEGSALTFTIVANPTKGTLSGSGANRTYTPNVNINGADSFTFKVNDGQADSNIATVTITINPVNDPPTATAQTVTTNEDAAKTITLAANDVEGSALTFTIVANPTKGTLTGSGASRTYTPNANANGTDSFTFKVNDGTADSNIATVTITVNPINDPPTATAQSVSTNKNTAKAITLGGSDVEGSGLTFAVVSNPTQGTLSGTAPNLTYTPATNYTGIDNFTFKTNDGSADSALATVSITVNATNGAPTANGQSVTTNEDVAKVITLTGSDPDGNPLSFTIVTAPTRGSLSGSAPNLTYTPSSNLNGSDSFTFRVSDGQLTSAAATVNITVNAVNDAPISLALSNDRIAENQPAGTTIGLLSSNDSDSGDSHTYTSIGGDMTAFSIVGNQLRTALAFDYETKALYQLTIRSTDQAGATIDQPLTIQVLDVNEGGSDATITIRLALQPGNKSNFNFNGSLGSFKLDDITPQDGDRYGNSQSFTVRPGTATIIASPPAKWLLISIACTSPEQATVDLARKQVTITATANAQITCTFALGLPSTLQVQNYNDLNGNGRRDGRERWLADWNFTLYREDGTAVVTQLTNRQGKASFVNVLPGTYYLCETVVNGWRNTQPATIHATLQQPCYTLVLPAAKTVTALFGNTIATVASQTELNNALDGITTIDRIDGDVEESDYDAPFTDDAWLTVEAETEVTEEQIYLPLISR